MDAEHKKILEDSIKDIFSIKDKFSDFEIASKFQLSISQLDLFKIIASLVVGIIGIGYFYSPNLDKPFLLASLIFALITLIFSISFTRETIDRHERQSKELHLMIDREAEEHIAVVMDSFKKDNFNLFSDYAKSRLAKEYPDPPLNWAGEIIIFCFYLSLGFLGASFFFPKLPDELILSLWFRLYINIWILFIVCIIGFKDWAFWVIQKISIFLNCFLSRKPKS